MFRVLPVKTSYGLTVLLKIKREEFTAIVEAYESLLIFLKLQGKYNIDCGTIKHQNGYDADSNCVFGNTAQQNYHLRFLSGDKNYKFFLMLNGDGILVDIIILNSDYKRESEFNFLPSLPEKFKKIVDFLD